MFQKFPENEITYLFRENTYKSQTIFQMLLKAEDQSRVQA